MPWCEACSKFWNPNSVPASGRCPTCGRELDTAKVTTAEPGEGTEAQEAGRQRTPWHFKLLLVAVVLYLGWRFIQMIGWVIG